MGHASNHFFTSLYIVLQKYSRLALISCFTPMSTRLLSPITLLPVLLFLSFQINTICVKIFNKIYHTIYYLTIFPISQYY